MARWSLLLILACSAWGQTWTLAHKEITQSGCSGAGTCTMSATITAGRVGVLIVGDSPSGALPSSITVGGTAWTVPAGCEIHNANGTAYVAYSLNTNSGTAFSVTGTFSTMGYAYYEYTLSGGTAAFDACNTLSTTCSGLNITGAALSSLTGHDVVLTEVGNPNNIIVTGVSAAYGNLQITPATGGTSAATADAENTSSGAAPTWSTSVCGAGVATGIAVTGGGGGATHGLFEPSGMNGITTGGQFFANPITFADLWAVIPAWIWRRRLAEARKAFYVRCGIVDRPLFVRSVLADSAYLRARSDTLRRPVASAIATPEIPGAEA